MRKLKYLSIKRLNGKVFPLQISIQHNLAQFNALLLTTVWYDQLLILDISVTLLSLFVCTLWPLLSWVHLDKQIRWWLQTQENLGKCRTFQWRMTHLLKKHPGLILLSFEHKPWCFSEPKQAVFVPKRFKYVACPVVLCTCKQAHWIQWV